MTLAINPSANEEGKRPRRYSVDRADVFTPDKKQLSLALARGGHNNKVIAAACKISYKTFMYAIECGRKEIVASEEDPEYAIGPTGQWLLDFESKRALHFISLLQSFQDGFAKDPRIAMAYLELLGRLNPEELGRRQVVKLEQEKTMKVVFVEKTGDGWQRGQIDGADGSRAQRVIESVKATAAPAPTERNEIIDTTIRESEDDNVF